MASYKDQKAKCEVEAAEGGEATLRERFNHCKKNPGHAHFIPIKEFQKNKHFDENIHRIISCLGDITVRLRVGKVSDSRPKFWPNSSMQYPLSNSKDKTTLHTGTGRVVKVIKNDGSWKIDLITATHVVFDNAEAKATSVRFFYDSEDSPLIFIEKCKLKVKHIDRDWCYLTCTTSDNALGERLQDKLACFEAARERIFLQNGRIANHWCFIVSHPHGCSKHVSIGQWLKKEQLDSNVHYSMFWYNTCTCPGSSGASVCVVGCEEWGWYDELVHSGTHCGLNCSGWGVIYV